MQKILIIQTAFIGDVILATSIIEKWKIGYPTSTIHFLLRSGNEPLLENNPHVDKVIVWDKRGRKWASYFSILKFIRRQHYSHVFNLHRFFSSGFLTVLSNAEFTCGFDKNLFSIFYSRKTKHAFGTNESPIHEVERNQQLIAEFTDNGFAMPKIYPSDSDFEMVPTTTPYITISPGSVWYTKQWPAENWISFINEVPRKFDVYLLGGNSESALCQRIKSETTNGKVEIRSGQLTFLQSAALMKNASMNYVNDSAPLHLASAVNAPVTALFCSTVPSFGFTPLSNNSATLETEEYLPCRPCGLHGKKSCPKGHFKCANIEITALLDRLK